MQIIAMHNISKSFPGTQALDHVNLSLEEGEIISLLGENGAGKTTLMNILYGIHQPDEGEIFFYGKSVHFKRPIDAIEQGICMVHQHFMLAPAFSILDNIIVGYEPRRGIILDRKKAYQEVKALIDKFNLNIDPNMKVSNLSVGEQQRVEILKALYRKAKVLILDEPTAVLAPNEVESLLKMLQDLRKGGTSIVIITHKLKETLSLADRVVVLRNGKLIRSDVRPEHTCELELAKLMVGRDIKMDVRRPSGCIGDVVLSVRNLTLHQKGIYKLREINFDIRKGEILGVAGVEGNGQSQLLAVITGQIRPDSLDLTINGKELTGDASDFIHNGFMNVPEDRTTMGLVLDLPLTDNTILGHHDMPFASRHGLMQQTGVINFTNQCIERFQVKTPNCHVLAKALSGGNQQKLIMARALSVDSDVLVVAQPVRGIDVSATEYIHDQIFNYRDRGKSVLLVSADLDEVYQMSDRLIVLYNGEIVLRCNPNDYTKEELGLYMLGAKKQEYLADSDYTSTNT